MGVHPDTLRRWEKEGRIEPAERAPRGQRCRVHGTVAR
ncbi:MAG: MerR family DNA-binding transcriptional regulator [Ferrimicrobium sp.]